MKKRTKIILVVVLVLVVVFVAWYFWFRKPKTIQTNTTTSKSPSTNTGSSTGTTPTAPVANDNFPLKLGSKGENVKYLQNAINRINGNTKLTEDGILGQQTYTAILFLGTRFWGPNGVTQSSWQELMDQANSI